MNHRILKLVPKKPQPKEKAKALQTDIDPKIMEDIRTILNSNNPLVVNGFKQTLSAYKHCYEVERRGMKDLKN